MIPKIIHYCWFGNNPLPELAKKCITSWKKFLPDYEIKEWNENNYDIRKIPYISQAYDAKKFAFVSDYARFDILYQYGGVYFDTDVELIKDFRPIIEKGAFIGVEKGSRILLNAGLGIASPALSPVYAEILDSYQSENFLYPNGAFNLKTVVDRVSEIFAKHGYVEKDILQIVANTIVYPSEFFCPKNLYTGEFCVTANTFAIHHYEGSWCSDDDKKAIVLHQKIFSIIKIDLLAKSIFYILRFFQRLKEHGLINGLVYFFKKYIWYRRIG